MLMLFEIPHAKQAEFRKFSEICDFLFLGLPNGDWIHPCVTKLLWIHAGSGCNVLRSCKCLKCQSSIDQNRQNCSPGANTALIYYAENSPKIGTGEWRQLLLEYPLVVIGRILLHYYAFVMTFLLLKTLTKCVKKHNSHSKSSKMM